MQKKIDAGLMNFLSKKGFELQYPILKSEEAIIDILNSNNERLYFAIPLLLIEELNYHEILTKIIDSSKIRFAKILKIAFEIEKKTSQIIIMQKKEALKIIKREHIYKKHIINDIEPFTMHYLDSRARIKQKEDKLITKELDMLSKYTTNEALEKLFSPGKRKILEKIYNRELLMKTEREFYYRSIRPISRALLNENLRKFISITESLKKYIKK